MRGGGEEGEDSQHLARLGLHRVADGLDSPGQAGEDSLHVAALLHGDDPGLVLLVHPQQEGLGLVVEDAAALGPVALHARDGQVGVAGDEQEVVVDELLADLLVHAGEGEVGAGQVAGQLGQGGLHQGLHLDPLVLGDAGGQAEAVDGPAHPDPGGVDRHALVDVALDVLHVHVGGVLGVGRDAVVLLDDGIWRRKRLIGTGKEHKLYGSHFGIVQGKLGRSLKFYPFQIYPPKNYKKKM